MGVSYLLRIVLPDRPGSLGEVASALGAVGADILALDVVEHRPDGTVVDDVLLEMPTGRMVDGAVSACRGVAGVRIDYLEPYPEGASLTRDLELVEAMAAAPADAERILTEHAADLVRFGWAVLLRFADGVAHVEHAGPGAPHTGGFAVPWWPLDDVRTLPDPRDWAPASWHGCALVATPLSGRDRALVVGRPGGLLLLPSEQARLGYLATIASTLRARPAPGPRATRTVDIETVDHVVLTVADVEASVAWYRDVLGMQPATFGDGRRAVHFGAHKLNFHPLDGGTAAPVAARPTPGSADLCLVVQDSADAVLVRLRSHGVEPETGPVRRTGARGPMTSVYVRDPDGNLVELASYSA
jgi:catechol 2,3-dioxygenase-like lactoylglutathione lyase family enzyme